jgi:catechol-2,3-dioxygenase
MEVHMPKIRHLAIRTEDTGKLASFYMDIFEMQVLHKDKREGGAVFLTDGYFNLAILPNHEQNAPNGLYHFGFEIESGEAIVDNMKKINYNKLPKPRPDGRPYAEVRGSDPDGNYFDISEHGFLKVEPVGEKKPS